MFLDFSEVQPVKADLAAALGYPLGIILIKRRFVHAAHLPDRQDRQLHGRQAVRPAGLAGSGLWALASASVAHIFSMP